MIPWDRTLSLGLSANGKTETGTLDLNGRDQRTATIGYVPASSLGYEPTATNPGQCYVTSATPATVEMSLPFDGTSYVAGQWSATRFTGQAGLRLTGDETYTPKFVPSTTEGLLDVRAGCVAFEANSGWYGDVKASGAGKVSFDASSMLNPDNSSEITLTDSAKLAVAAGVALSCSKFSVGGNGLGVGTYDAKNLPGRLVGDGCLKVRGLGAMILMR